MKKPSKKKKIPEPKRINWHDFAAKYTHALSDEEVDDEYADAIADDFELFCAYEAKVKSIDGKMVYAALNDEQRKITRYALKELFAGRPVLLIILKPRQEGFSTWVALFFSWLTFFIDNFETMVLAHDEDATDTLLSKYQTIWDEASPDIRPGIDRSNRRLGMHYTNGSSIRIASAGTKAVAGKKGRSKTLQAVHFSEAAFYEDADALCGGIKSTIHLGPWKIVIFESTANGAAGYFYEQCKLANDGKSDYKFWFVAWHDVASNAIQPSEEQEALWARWRASGRESVRIKGGFEKDEDGLIEEHGLSCEQWLWWTYTYRNVCDNDLDRMRQEYPSDYVSCFLATGRPVFPYRQVNALRKECWEPERVDISLSGITLSVARTGDGQFMVWQDPIEGAVYLMSADVCSGSTADDYSVIWVWRAYADNIEMVAGYIGQPDPDELAQLMNVLGRWYNTALAAPESNTYGQEVIRTLVKLSYPSIFREVGWDKAEGEMLKNRLGLRVTPTNRGSLIASFKGLLRRGQIIVRYEPMLDEMNSYVFDRKSNKPQALPGKHDDMVSAAIIATYIFESDDDGQISDGQGRAKQIVVDIWNSVEHFDKEDDRDQGVVSLEEHLEHLGWA